MRQADLISEEKLKDLHVCIFGCGGIGSHTALALARMGVGKLTLIDPDEVDTHNVSSQGFDIDDVGTLKVEATAYKCFKAVRMFPKVIAAFVHEDTTIPTADVYILAVDSMKSRKEIFNAIRNQVRFATVINAGMGAEYLAVDTYHGNTAETYELFNKGFYTDEEAKQERCTAKATIYTTLLVSGFICKVIKDVLQNDKFVKRMVYDIANNMPVMLFDNEQNNLMD